MSDMSQLRIDARGVAWLTLTRPEVHNAFDDRVSISIHVYGANIGAVRRHVYPEAGGSKSFISGYSNFTLPNLWDRSKDPVAAP